MNSSPQNFAILFADIAGSTRLYERLGDIAAREIISALVTGMTGIANRHGGILIKTIGDEIMCRFDDASAAVSGAIAIQEAARDLTLGSNYPAQIRSGLHYGPALLENNDVFGDAVNVAARMAGLAKAGQIVTTEATVATLTPALATKCRQVDATNLKGKADEFSIHEIVWEENNATMILSSPTSPALATKEASLVLEFEGLRLELQAGESASIGRSDQCDLAIPSSFASRQHARIEYRRGKFILTDQSTNGTFVVTADGKQVFLKREELPLWETGLISLGEEPRADGSLSIRFRVS